MKCGVVVFPGSNCDHDVYHVFKHVLQQEAAFLWHQDETVQDCDLVVLPGGFAYGDYLRAGALAALSPVMAAVRPGAGRERRRDRHRRRPGGGLQDGEPQPSRASSSPIRARRPASAASCATSSPWARGRSPASTRCASARRSIRRPAIWSSAWSPASAATAIRSACRRSAARCVSTPAMTATSWSTRWRSASPTDKIFYAAPPASATCRSSISAPRPAATASTAPPWRRPNSTTIPRRSARPCRSAIPSPRSCCWKPASN
jgi:hypothetical protein